MTEDPLTDLPQPVTKEKPLQAFVPRPQPAALRSAFTTVGELLIHHQVLDLVQYPPTKAKESGVLFSSIGSAVLISLLGISLLHGTKTLCHYTNLP